MTMFKQIVVPMVFLFIGCGLVSCDEEESSGSECLGEDDSLCGVTNDPEDLRPAEQGIINLLSTPFEGVVADDEQNPQMDPCRYTGESFVLTFHSFSDLDCGDDDCADALVATMLFSATLEVGGDVYEFSDFEVTIRNVSEWETNISNHGTSSDSAETKIPYLFYENDSETLHENTVFSEFKFSFGEPTDDHLYLGEDVEVCYLTI
jgi:hypothetical protein